MNFHVMCTFSIKLYIDVVCFFSIIAAIILFWWAALSFERTLQWKCYPNTRSCHSHKIYIRHGIQTNLKISPKRYEWIYSFFLSVCYSECPFSFKIFYACLPSRQSKNGVHYNLYSILEHLNIILFELAQTYHGILTKVDIVSSSDPLSGKVSKDCLNIIY